MPSSCYFLFVFYSYLFLFPLLLPHYLPIIPLSTHLLRVQDIEAVPFYYLLSFLLPIPLSTYAPFPSFLAYPPSPPIHPLIIFLSTNHLQIQDIEVVPVYYYILLFLPFHYPHSLISFLSPRISSLHYSLLLSIPIHSHSPPSFPTYSSIIHLSAHLLRIHVVEVVLDKLYRGLEVRLVELVGDVPAEGAVLPSFLDHRVEEGGGVEESRPLVGVGVV